MAGLFRRIFGNRGGMRGDLARIDDWLRTHRPNYHSSLAAPATSAELDAFENTLSCKLPTDFRDLYLWHDGQELGAGALVDNHQFLSLTKINDVKQMLDEMISHDFEDPDWWKDTWVPFTRSYGGDCMCIDLSKSGHVLSFWHDEAERTVRAPSLAAWVHDLITPMENGTYEAD